MPEGGTVMYTFPKMLAPLREYLAGQGADVKSFVSARQAAFMAQQLIGSRVRFPPQGQDMTSTLLQIQQAVPADAKPIVGKSKKPTKAKTRRVEKNRVEFKPEMFAEGIHIFCDGAAVPNPGLGGWGVAVFKDGVEVDSAYGGDPEATNNQMELTAIIMAIEAAAKHVAEWSRVTIWSDSQYCVNGCNDWRHSWKAKGWQRGGPNARPENRLLMNADLWKAIDAALEELEQFGKIEIKWVKGHIGIAGNERADELAEMGRQEVEAGARGSTMHLCEDLDDAYRKIMGSM